MKRYLSQSVLERQWSVWIIPIGVFVGIILCALGVIWFYFGPGFAALWGDELSFSSSPEIVHIEMGGALFPVPGNYTRYGRDRRADKHQHVILHAVYPDMSGYDSDTADAIETMDERVILMTLLEAEDGLPLAHYFDKIYKPELISPHQKEAWGYDLDAFHFREGSSYHGRTLLRHAEDTGLSHRPHDILFLCEADMCETRLMPAQNVQVSYRIHKNLLVDWRRIDQSIYQLFKSWRANARKIRSE